MRKHLTKLIALTLAGLLTLTGCSNMADTPAGQQPPTDVNSLLNQAEDTLKDKLGQYTGQTGQPNTTITGDIPDWTLSQYPDYYTVTGKADYTNISIPQAGTISYATPDQYGRSGYAIGVITKQMRDNGSDRDRNMPDTITGWPEHNPKVTINLTEQDTCSMPKASRPKNSCYSGYLFNKSHLIAKSLGGEDSPTNMVTGTRTQNVGRNQPAGGMAYTETEARDWLDRNPNGTITYMATPVYEGSELLPRYVTVDIQSSDKSIDQHVIVWNTANGYDIDYQNGGVK